MDINGSHDRVRKIQAAYLNHLIDIGVAGFRSDASKHMWPADIAAIQNLVSYQMLNFVEHFTRSSGEIGSVWA